MSAGHLGQRKVWLEQKAGWRSQKRLGRKTQVVESREQKGKQVGGVGQGRRPKSGQRGENKITVLPEAFKGETEREGTDITNGKRRGLLTEKDRQEGQ